MTSFPVLILLSPHILELGHFMELKYSLGEFLSTFLRIGGVSISRMRDSIGVRGRGTREPRRVDLSDTW